MLPFCTADDLSSDFVEATSPKEAGLAFTSAKICSANFFASSFVRFTPFPAALPV